MKTAAMMSLIQCLSASQTETGAMLQMQSRSQSLLGASAGQLAKMRSSVVQLLQEGATPAVTTFVEETLASLESRVFPGIEAGHEGDVKLVESCKTRFEEVNANYTARAGNFRDHQTGMEAEARDNHRVCREAELDACDAAKECWETHADLVSKFSGLHQSYLAAVSRDYCPAEEVVDPMESAEALSKASSTISTQRSHYDGTLLKHSLQHEAWKAAEEKRARCEALDEDREEKGKECAGQRALLEGASCVALSKHTDAATAFAAEWQMGEEFFESISTAVKANTEDRVREFTALTEVRCILEAVKEKGGQACEAEDAEQTIAACKQQSEDSTQFDINYDMPSKASEVAMPAYPCTEAYDAAEYGELTDDCFQDLGECSPCEGQELESKALDFQLFVLGTKHAHGHVEKYFNFHWDARLDEVESFDTHGSKRIKATQCRKGQKVWEGDITFWHGVNGGQGQGDSHGRRSDGSAAHQWEAGDVVTSKESCPLGQGTFAMQVLGTKHASGLSGKYFNFDWQSSLDHVASFDEHGSKRIDDARQCRAGAPVWQGSITFWNGVNGGHTGNSHGRRSAGSDANQWAAGDLITDGACPEQLR